MKPRAAVAAMAVFLFAALASAAPTQIQKLTASDAEADDGFTVTSIDGDTIVAQAAGEDTGASGAGAAYVFTRSGSTWTQQQKLLAADPLVGNAFGRGDVDGDTIVIGAPHPVPCVSATSGSAYVFTRSGSTWTQQQKLQASDPASCDQFGIGVAISGDTIVVGSWFEETAGVTDAGAAYVFTRSGSTWTQQQKLQASDPLANAQFGQTLDLLGNTLLVAAPTDPAEASNAGSAYVFTRSGSTWTQQQKLVAPDAAANDQFGGVVTMGASLIAIGACQTASDTGKVYLFQLDGTWEFAQQFTAADSVAGDGFCGTVLGDDILMVGATGHDSAASNAGAIYVFNNLLLDPTEDVEPTFEPRPVEPGGIFGDNGAAFGGNKSALAASMEISVTALEIGMAILWILLFTAIGFLTFNRSMAGALSGGLGGVVWSIAWGLIPLWFVFMLIILTGAGLLVLRRRA